MKFVNVSDEELTITNNLPLLERENTEEIEYLNKICIKLVYGYYILQKM